MQIPAYVNSVLQTLENAGYSAYVVGGAVRDHLRGGVPTDWDVATSALPQQIQRAFSAYETVLTGLAHGTVTVLVQGKSVEVTSFRREGTYTDRRHPDSVSFGCDLTQDLARRDLTVNAIAYSPTRGLADPFGGREDLKRGILRTVGEPEKRFDEDALRMLRTLRFGATLGFEIEESTARAITRGMESLRQVSAQRLQKELLLLLEGAHAPRILQAFGGLLPLLLGLSPRQETLSLLSQARGSALRLALLWEDRPVDEARLAMRELTFSNSHIRAVTQLLTLGRAFPEDTVDRILLWGQTGKDFLALCQYHCLRTAENLGPYQALFERLEREKPCATLAGLCLKGDDLTALGLRGKEISGTLQGLLRRVVAGELPNEKKALLRAVEKNT